MSYRESAGDERVDLLETQRRHAHDWIDRVVDAALRDEGELAVTFRSAPALSHVANASSGAAYLVVEDVLELRFMPDPRVRAKHEREATALKIELSTVPHATIKALLDPDEKETP